MPPGLLSCRPEPAAAAAGAAAASAVVDGADAEHVSLVGSAAPALGRKSGHGSFSCSASFLIGFVEAAGWSGTDGIVVDGPAVADLASRADIVSDSILARSFFSSINFSLMS